MIIGFAGAKRCGKDTATAYLLKKFKNAEQVMLAEPLKLGLIAMFGFTWEQVNGIGYDREQPTEYGVSIREMLQTLGTEWGREMIHPDVWVKLQLKKMQEDPTKIYVMSDVRFENEAALVREHGTLIHIRAGVCVGDTHKSENGVTFKDGDRDLINRKDGVENYHAEIDKVLIDIFTARGENP